MPVTETRDFAWTKRKDYRDRARPLRASEARRIGKV
jgi:hypothetical protein